MEGKQFHSELKYEIAWGRRADYHFARRLDKHPAYEDNNQQLPFRLYGTRSGKQGKSMTMRNKWIWKCKNSWQNITRKV